MRKPPNNIAGFTFVESIIAFSIVGILLLMTWATVNFLLLKTNEQIVKTRAHFLAMEGIEIMKQIRSTAVNEDRENGFLTSIGHKENGNYIIKMKGDAFVLEKGINQIINMNEDPFIDYCRTIQIDGNSESIKKIVSTVRWGGVDCNTGENTISYSSYLADLSQ